MCSQVRLRSSGAQIVAAAVQIFQLFVGLVADHLEQFRILAEKLLPQIGPAFRLERLIIPVDTLFHSLEQ